MTFTYYWNFEHSAYFRTPYIFKAVLHPFPILSKNNTTIVSSRNLLTFFSLSVEFRELKMFGIMFWLCLGLCSGFVRCYVLVMFGIMFGLPVPFLSYLILEYFSNENSIVYLNINTCSPFSSKKDRPLVVICK